MFDVCKCTVAIGGDVRAVVSKPFVTIAEIVLLQTIHGGDAVNNIRVWNQIDSSTEIERDRLGVLYKDAKVIEIFQQFGELPKTLSEARISPELLDPSWDKEKPKKPKNKPASRKRARTEKGHFVKDDPETPDNEAYVEE
jgi:hypothetical protein|tara:strand:- start:337 stop:756 length:420 start_codon:yes stop_codon:yes gene_type:complete